MYIHDLQSQLQFLRRDLETGFVDTALQDAARWVAIKTGIVRKKVYDHVNVNTLTVDLPTFMGSVVGGFTILRPVHVMYYPGIKPGSICTSTITVPTFTIPLATVAPDLSFYVAGVDTNLFDGVTHYLLNAGDSLQVIGKKWVTNPVYKYNMADDVQKTRLQHAHPSPYNQIGGFNSYVVGNGDIKLIPIPNCDTPVSIECSIVPIKEFENIGFPIDAEDALLYAAKWRLYAIPNKSGGGADEGKADKYMRLARDEAALVRGIAEFGYGDVEMAPPPLFGS